MPPVICWPFKVFRWLKTGGMLFKNAIICPSEICILWHRSKGIKERKPWRTTKKKGACTLLAPGQTNVLRIYYLWALLYFQRTAVDLKQLINTQSKHAFSFGPDADYRCHKTWNLITSTLSFDAMSCLQSSANTWLWHLGSAGLSADGNCHFVSMRGSEVHVWGGNIRSGICESCSWHIKSSGCTFFSHSTRPVCLCGTKCFTLPDPEPERVGVLAMLTVLCGCFEPFSAHLYFVFMPEFMSWWY